MRGNIASPHVVIMGLAVAKVGFHLPTEAGKSGLGFRV